MSLITKIFQSKYTQVILIILFSAGLFVGGFFMGRSSTPERAVEQQKEEKKTETKTEVVQKEKTETQKAEDTNVKKNVRRKKTVIEKSDGTKITRETEDTNLDRSTTKTEIKYIDREVVKIVEQKVVETKEVTKTVESHKPDWRAGVMVGVNVFNPKPMPVFPYFESAAIGGHLERRIAGPVFVGGWFMSNGSGGISLSAEF